MRGKLTLVVGSALLAASLALSGPSYAQDRKAPPKQGMMMQGDMMARMNAMMDRCEKMMSSHGMQKGMRHRKGA